MSENDIRRKYNTYKSKYIYYRDEAEDCGKSCPAHPAFIKHRDVANSYMVYYKKALDRLGVKLTAAELDMRTD